MDAFPEDGPAAGAAATRERGRRIVSVRAKVEILFAVILTACASILLVVDHRQRSEVDLLLRDRTLETSRVLQRILALRAQSAATHADDYTRWDDFVAFARKPTERWARINLTENIATFGLDAAWVLDDHRRLVYSVNPSGAPAFAGTPVPLPQLASALRTQPIRHFFTETPLGLLEVWTSSIQPSDDLHRRQPPSGYYVVGRLWTETRLTELSRVADGAVRTTPGRPGDLPGRPPGRSAARGMVHVVLPLPDLQGRPVEWLTYDTAFPVARHVDEALRFSLILLVAAGALSFIVVALVLTGWVTRPLALVTRSLREENPSLLYRTIRRHDEFGQLARLVREFFAQRKSLIEARQAAEEAGEAKQRFLTSISHELRTPMHGVLSFARFGEKEALTADREELLDYFRQIDTGGTRLISLLDELLDVAKFDAGRMKLEFAPFPLGEIAREAAQEFSGICLERRIALDVRIDPETPSVVLDRGRVHQVIRNLLSNAAKFTPAQGTIALFVTGDDLTARVTVEDTGAGVPSNELELIFGKFSQATNNRRASGGTGLGLSLCREIVVAHGGRIWAENREPKGARMTFELPLSGPPDARPSGETQAAA